MRLLHYLEIENFKRFGDKQRLELDHPSVLIGPNNCGKTTAIQAIALWSQAVKTWRDKKGKAPPAQRTSTALNRLNIVSVPVQRTRYFWHNANVRRANTEIPLIISVGVLHEQNVVPVTMEFRNQGEDIVYCTPGEQTLQHPEVLETAASLGVELLYPMSGLDTEEPILQPGRIDVLLGQGQTAQVLRNLCLMVYRESPDDWGRIADLVKRLFSVEIGHPQETSRGSIDLFYRQQNVKEHLDVALAGRGFQQMLMIFAYLYSHRRSVLLIDEPDAHLEILRQRQVYVLLREIAAEIGSQVILVTHSEVVLDEALDRNLTLLLGGRADDLAAKTEIRNALKLYGAEHYARALQRGYVLYVEGGTDLDILRAFANRTGHGAAEIWDERINTYYVQDNHPDSDLDSELERVEGGYGETPRNHFNLLREIVPGLKGLAILDSDGRPREDKEEGGLRTVYWRRYESENYFVSPEILKKFAESANGGWHEGGKFGLEVDEVLDKLILERIYSGDVEHFDTYRESKPAQGRVIWELSTQNVKLSDFAEEFFRRLAARLGHPMLLRKGELHRLIKLVEPAAIPDEVTVKLDLLAELFAKANPPEEAWGE